MSLHATIAKKAAAGLAAAGIAIGIMGASAGAASAATPTTFAHNHHVTVAVQYQVHQNELFNKADNNSVKYTYRDITRGMVNNDGYFGGYYGTTAYVQSDFADHTWGTDQFYLREADSSGTLHVTDVQGVQFVYWPDGPGGPSWIGGTAIQQSVDIAPGATRSYFIETDDSGGDYVWSMVTITNNVS